MKTHRYLYGAGTDQVLIYEIGWTKRFLLTDHQGTIRDYIDENGAVTTHVSYDSYGKLLSSNPGRFGFTGREQDSESGLLYYRRRYYDPGPGRFINQDPAGFDAGDGNLYRYVFNSPVNLTDPSGLGGGMADGRRGLDSPAAQCYAE